MATKRDFSVLEQLERWLNLREDEQDAVVRDLEQWLQGEYVHQYTLSYSDEPSLRIPTFRHLPTGLEFNLIVGGRFNMGLSVQEEAAFRNLIEEEAEKDYLLKTMEEFMVAARPVHTVLVRPFMMSRFPILNSFAREHLELEPDDFISEYEVDDDNELVPASLTREQINVLMEKFRFSLPSEAQWEYAYRGGTTTLFYWGDDLFIDEDKIALHEFSEPETCKKAANPLGLVGMAVGEWCADSYRPDYRSATGNDLPVVGGSPYVVRGGAAMTSPWQNCGEWLTCVSAVRLWEDDSPDSDSYSGRFVKVLDLKG